MIVVDASAVTIAVTDMTERGNRSLVRADDEALAPYLIDAEVGQAVRGLLLRGILELDAAVQALDAADVMVAERFPHEDLRERAWQLRWNVSFYDGLYVALAEAMEVPLLTADAKLASAFGPQCEIELV